MGDDILDRVVRLFAARGESAYFGEPVSQAEHALQSAVAAERDGADVALIAAALLHDVGHLLSGLAEDAAESGIDDRHEELGARWLARYFDPRVASAVRLHVPAKRFLCATEPAYPAGLSPASLTSLRLQGGPFAPAEAEAFRADPSAEDAVRLRRWDDQAKIPGLPTPGLTHFLPYLERALARPQGDRP
jgi:phosphonate degradation associated HDIG domain protein